MLSHHQRRHHCKNELDSAASSLLESREVAVVIAEQDGDAIQGNNKVAVTAETDRPLPPAMALWRSRRILVASIACAALSITTLAIVLISLAATDRLGCGDAICARGDRDPSELPDFPSKGEPLKKGRPKSGKAQITIL